MVRLSGKRLHNGARKLLFVGAYPPPFGGIASHLSDLIPELRGEGYDAVTITPSQRAQRRDVDSIISYYINYKRYFFKNALRVIFWFVKCILCKKDLSCETYLKAVNEALIIADVAKKEHVDAVFIYMIDHGYAIPVLKKMINSRISIVLMIFGEFYLSPAKHKACRAYLKDVFDNSDKLLSSSEHCARSISKVIGYDYPVKVIYIGVNEQLYVPGITGDNIRKKHSIPEGAVVFLFFGRMTVDMGLDFLLRVAKKLLGERDDVYLLIVGAEGELSEKAMELASKEKRVSFCVNVPYSDKVDYYHACDVLLAPTMQFHACMGVSIKEAMSCGKPVIASESGGIPEAVEDEVNGYIVPIVDGRVDESVLIERALTLAKDANLRTTMGMRGRKKVESVFRNRKTVEDYLQVIEEMYGGARQSI